MFQRSLLIFAAAGALCTVSLAQDTAKKVDAPLVNGPGRVFAFTMADDTGYLGVQTVNISKDDLAKFNISSVRGVGVEKVLENSPAATAGIQKGDVILRLDGEEITSVRKLTRLIGEVAPDHQVRITISRNGSEQELTATVAKRPAPKFENGNFAFGSPRAMGSLRSMTVPLNPEEFGDIPAMPSMPDMQGNMAPKVFSFPNGGERSMTWAFSGRQIGVGVVPMSKQLAQHFGVDGGVLVNTVMENSAAAKGGVEAGDIIVEVEGKAVNSNLELIRAIGEKKDGSIQLTVVRDAKRRALTVTPEESKDRSYTWTTDGKDS